MYYSKEEDLLGGKLYGDRKKQSKRRAVGTCKHTQ